MSVERRGQVIRVTTRLVNWQQEELTDRGEGRQLFMNDKSRVSREAQARFREGLGVKFPGATRPTTERTGQARGHQPPSGPVLFLERISETYLSLTWEAAAAGQVRQHEEGAG